MSININLLPDTKQAKIKDKNYSRLAITISVIVVVVCSGLILLSLIIIGGQKLRITQLTSSIADKKKEVSNYPNVTTMLSLQARVEALPSLYSQRAYMTRLLDILTTTEPNDVAFTSLAVPEPGKLTISAEGKTYMAAARLARALEQSKLASGNQTFQNVTLSAVTLQSGKTSYGITAEISAEALSASK